MNAGAGTIRPTAVTDIVAIGSLIQEHSFTVEGEGALLAVSPQEILRMVGDPSLGRFFTAVGKGGEIVGCVAVTIYGMPENHSEILGLLSKKLPLLELGIDLKDTASPHDHPSDLVAELRSLVVGDGSRGRNLGLALIEAAKAEARTRGFLQLYSLVNERVEPLFERAGFKRASRTPQKLLVDCAVCPILDRCNELPVVVELGRELVG